MEVADGNAVRLGVPVGTGGGVGVVVGVGGTEVSVGLGVPVNGKTVSVSGSVGWDVTVMVMPGSGVKVGVRVATFGTQRVSLG